MVTGAAQAFPTPIAVPDVAAIAAPRTVTTERGTARRRADRKAIREMPDDDVLTARVAASPRGGGVAGSGSLTAPRVSIMMAATLPVHPQATGGDYLVRKPTLFLAGEAGPERATFTLPITGTRLSAVPRRPGASPRGVQEMPEAFHAVLPAQASPNVPPPPRDDRDRGVLPPDVVGVGGVARVARRDAPPVTLAALPTVAPPLRERVSASGGLVAGGVRGAAPRRTVSLAELENLGRRPPVVGVAPASPTARGAAGQATGVSPRASVIGGLPPLSLVVTRQLVLDDGSRQRRGSPSDEFGDRDERRPSDPARGPRGTSDPVGRAMLPVYPQASGGDYLVQQPTLYLAHPGERATFTPANKPPLAPLNLTVNVQVMAGPDGTLPPLPQAQLHGRTIGDAVTARIKQEMVHGSLRGLRAVG